jgi:hypothetical protein
MWPRTVSEIFELVPEEELAKTGERVGSVNPKEVLAILGRSTDWNAVVFYIDELLGDYCNWFALEHYVEDKKHHNLGMKWSIFVKSYVDQLLKSLLNYEAKFGVNSSLITFEVIF